MYLVLSVVLPLLILPFGECVNMANITSTNDTQSRPRPFSMISVANGQIWGTWGLQQMCPTGTYATGFSLKVLIPQEPRRDDTALNGIALRCSRPISSGVISRYSTVTSDFASWGVWTQDTWCKNGVLKAFQLQVQPSQGAGDDTAANNIQFKCTGDQVLVGSGTGWGSWGKWSPDCPGTGICGIQTKVQPPQGVNDDTALNDVRFFCCS
ncbi:vitelline membrane outer layer protein 1-like [Trichomycterus rosablanca]|uniref:vitelline membrane outer layer protein 1-like n=1 Tax=Trichomycterus rosablanca TaxID=2290929 RepID=UPI002F360C3B